MFFGRDGSFGLEYWFWPLKPWNDRFQQPFHAKGVIMYPPKINVCRHFAVVQCPVEMFWPGFRYSQLADAIEILVFDCGFPAG